MKCQNDQRSFAEDFAPLGYVPLRLLHLVNTPSDLHDLMRESTKLLQQWSGCTAVSIRLRDGDDFPYFETRGFPAEFIQAENSLCACDLNGQIARQRQGHPVLECMCDNILCGRFDPALPFFTRGGSFWTNSTSQLLAGTSEADRQSRTRNRCNGEGYESVALIPLRADGNTFGLLQLNDRRTGRFTAELIASLEALAAALAEAVTRRQAVNELRSSRDQLQQQTERLCQAERHLRGLLDAVDQSVMLLEPDGTILDCNRTFAERLGHQRSEILGQDAYALLPPETAELRRQHMDEAVRLRSPVQFVDERWGRRMAHRIVPILDDRDEILRFAVQGADITEETRLAEGLQASNKLLKAVKDAQSLFITETDPGTIFAGLLRILVQATQSEYGFLDEVVYQEGQPVLKRSLAISDISWDEASRRLYEQLRSSDFVFPNLENLAGAPAVSGEVVIANDAVHHARSRGLPPGHPPLKSFLGIPMRHAAEIVGVAGVANRPGGYTRELAEFLEPLTTACASMIVALRAERNAEEAQEALRRRENHFKLLYEQAPLGYQSLDAEGRFLEVNPAWLDLLGYAREEVLGRSFAEFLIAEDRPLFETRFPLFKKAGVVRGSEFEMICKDGSRITASVDGRIARDEQGRFIQTHCILHDVTARKQSEKLVLIERNLVVALSKAAGAQQVAKAALHAALEATGLACGGVYLFDDHANEFRLQCHKGVSEEFARAAAAYGPDSGQGRIATSGQVVQLEGEAIAASPFAVVVEEGLVSVTVVPILHDGRTVGTLNIGSRNPVRSAANLLHALEAVAAQTGEALARVQAREALRQSQAELQAVYDSSPVMMCVLDSQRRVLYMNRRMADFIGRPENDLLGQRACGVIGCVNGLEDPCGYGHDCQTCSIRQALADTLETGRGHRGIERRMTLATGAGPRDVVLLAATELIPTKTGMNLLIALEDITERKRAENALRDSEARLRDLAANIPGAIYQFVRRSDGSYEIPFMSDGAVNLLGKPLDDLQNPSILFGNVHPDDLEGVWQSIEESARTLQPWRCEFRIDASGGDYKWLRGASNPSLRSDESICWNGVLIDLTERVEAEQTVRVMAAMLDSAPSLIMIHDFHGRFLYANRKAVEAHGYSRREFMALSLQDLDVPESDALRNDRMRRVVEHGEESFEVTHFRKDGTVFPLEIVAKHVAWAGKSAVMSVGTDITERKRLEMQLRDSESLLSRAEAIVGMGSFVWDVSSDRVTPSAGMRQLSGLTQREYPNSLADAITRLVDPQDQPRVAGEAQRMAAERRAWPLEFRTVRADGELRLVHCESEAILDATGQLTRLIGTLHDITDRRAIENRLNSMQLQLNHVSRLAVMGELLAGVAHEVNQPLCSIVNFAKACRNVASQEPANLEQICQWTESINGAATRAGDIVQRMLGFARRHGSDWESVHVAQVVDDALLLLRHEARTHHVALKCELPEDDLAIPMRPGQIQQVLVNLLHNSIEALSAATRNEKRIDLCVRRLANEVEISLADNGEGIGETELQSLFEPFFTTKPRGLGLGLAISRTIVEDHGGRIQATANSSGGLTVSFTLPLGKALANDE